MKTSRATPSNGRCVSLAILCAVFATVSVVLSSVVPATSVRAEEKPKNAFGVPGFEMERFSWTGQAGEGTVTVVNLFGDVRGRFGGYEGEVEIFANLQQFAEEGPRLEVETQETPSGVEVTVGYRDASGELITTRDPAQKKRADMVVFVPLGAPLRVSTDHGQAQFKRVRSDIHATTVSGSISVREVQGHLNLESVSGSILATLEPIDVERGQSAITESGDATVYVSEDASLTVHAATNAQLSTDYSMTVDYRADRQPIKRGEAVIGKGSEPMRIESGSGRVWLNRRPSAHQARVQPEESPPVAPRPQAGADAVVVDLAAVLATSESPISVETVTGDVTVFVDPGTNATILLATSGEITVDYSVEIDYRHREEPAKHGLVKIGGGANQVRLTSRQGTVAVLRRP